MDKTKNKITKVKDLKSKKAILERKTSKDNNELNLKEEDISINQKFQEIKTPTKHITVPVKDKFLFLYTFLKKFNDKNIVVIVATREIAQVSP